jgi:hypothetical protein
MIFGTLMAIIKYLRQLFRDGWINSKNGQIKMYVRRHSIVLKKHSKSQAYH